MDYQAHEVRNPDSRLIRAFDGVAGNADVAVRTDVLLGKERAALEGEAVGVGDGLYNHATTIA